MPTRVLIPAGVLGLGFDQTALARGVAAQPDIICIDGGSTDSGPFYLGTSCFKKICQILDLRFYGTILYCSCSFCKTCSKN